jgi:hypothetical protein
MLTYADVCQAQAMRDVTKERDMDPSRPDHSNLLASGMPDVGGGEAGGDPAELLGIIHTHTHTFISKRHA